MKKSELRQLIREEIKGLNEGMSSDDEQGIRDAIKQNKGGLMGLSKYLKSNGYRDAELVMLDMMPPHIKLKIDGKDYIIINVSYLAKKSEADFIVGDIAVGTA
jgi:hypothetical protein